MRFIAIFIVLLSFSCANKATPKVSETPKTTETTTASADVENIYQFVVKNIEGSKFDLSTLKGKKVMIVNTASKCGLTPQYEGLETLYQTYKDQNFTIIGFPANNFMGQEPGTDQDIASFCQLNYGVSFPMMSKVSVKGKDMHRVYKYLTSKDQNGLEDNNVKWNFQKYLINEEGFLEKIIAPGTTPLEAEITNWITGK